MKYEPRTMTNEEWDFIAETLKVHGVISCRVCCFTGGEGRFTSCLAQRAQHGLPDRCEGMQYYVEVPDGV